MLLRDWLERRSKFQLLVGFLVVCAASVQSLPLLQPWGADLHNLHVYQKCAGDHSPYPIDGPACGDLWGRPMIYPPLLYHSFRWLRSLTLETAMRIWTTFVFVAFVGIMFVWTRRIARRPTAAKDDAEVAIFCALLLLQYPFIFTLERGGTDIGALLFFTLGAYAFTRFGPVWAGCAVGLAAAYKLYPAIAVAVLFVALALTEVGPALAAPRRGAWRRFGAAASLRFGGAA
ncbi:MAG: DUF2029 domain-containing protein, partial [Myxococcota bacterium]|nr:DUF2029 domain-containing protein [Myxococcota bacterium]